MKTLKSVTLNFNTTMEEIESLNVGDRITLEDSGKVGGFFSQNKIKKNNKFLYEIIFLKDNGLLDNVYFLRPTN